MLGASTVTNTGSSVITGDLGVSPGTAVTGFAPGLVASGTIHSADAAALAAQDAVTAAYNSLVGQACTRDLTGQDLGGQTLTAGVYCFSSSAQLTGTLTLDAQGNANAVFIFKMGSTLTTASASSVVLINGASAGNVFWQVGSSATLGTTTSFAGNILALASITVTTGVRVTGRTLARNGAVTLDTNAVTATNPTSAVTTTVGGAQTTGSGLSFWDVGTLAARLQAGVGTRVLSAADASARVGESVAPDVRRPQPARPDESDQRRCCRSRCCTARSPAGRPHPSIVWGTPIQDPQGVGIVWDTSGANGIVWDTSDSDGIVWDTAVMTSPDPK